MTTLTNQQDTRDTGYGSQGSSNYTERKEMVLTRIISGKEQVGRYRLRKATMDDLEAAFELFDACSKHMIGKSETTLAHIRTEWTSPGFILESAVRVVETPDHKLVGYIEVWDMDEPPVSIWVSGRVHPAYEGQGIGTMLMEWAEEKSRKAISRTPEDARVIMRSGTFSHYQPAHDLLSGSDMTLNRHFLTMAIDLDHELESPSWPESIELRLMNGSGEEETKSIVHAEREAFKDHWGYVETPFEQEFEQWLHFIRNDEKFDPSLWFLAMDGEEIAGMSLCRIESDEDPDMGWVSVLGVLRPWRRKGLGLALLHHSFHELKNRGKRNVGLGVDASSLTGATGLYEKAGMQTIRQFDTYEKELRPGRDLTKQSL